MPRIFDFTNAILRRPGASAVKGLRADGGPDPTFAGVAAEHTAYAAALEAAGLELTLLDPLEDFPDALFVEDPALVFTAGAVLLNPGAPSRAGEAALLRPALERGTAPSAVVVSSVASVQLPWSKNPIGAALEAGDEAQVATILAGAGERAGQLAYASSKNALTVAVRRRVPEWGRAGVRLNAVAPGAVETPLLQASLADPRYGQAIRDFVAPIPRRARPDEIAATIVFLLGADAGYIHGAQIVVDGGIDALARPTQF